jgi:hypothetical protein
MKLTDRQTPDLLQPLKLRNSGDMRIIKSAVLEIPSIQTSRLLAALLSQVYLWNPAEERLRRIFNLHQVHEALNVSSIPQHFQADNAKK